jgi:aspartyl-tRNA(Asn)/glutamyl-tRNA(Gln) amidotransferase subunit C
VAVTPDDVRHVAALARLGLAPERVEPLVAELNGILAHMDVLSAVPAADLSRDGAAPPAPTPLREDEVSPVPLARPREAFAPATRDGFFVVPRLPTHDEERTAP